MDPPAEAAAPLSARALQSMAAPPEPEEPEELEADMLYDLDRCHPIKLLGRLAILLRCNPISKKHYNMIQYDMISICITYIYIYMCIDTY